MNQQQKDVTTTAAINVYTLAVCLVEELDKLESSNIKKTLRNNIKKVIKGLEHFDKNVINNLQNSEKDTSLYEVVKLNQERIYKVLNKKID